MYRFIQYSYSEKIAGDCYNPNGILEVLTRSLGLVTSVSPYTYKS